MRFSGGSSAPSPGRVPPRRAGNFLLVAQKKVTKEEGLRQKPLSSFFSLRTPGPAGDLTTRGRSPHQPARTLRARCASPWAFKNNGAPTPGLRNGAVARRCGAAAAQILTVSSRRCAASRSVRASRWRDGRHSVRSPAGPGMRSEKNELRGVCLQALCFGDFHLGPQMKVTRPPGRDPAACESAAAHRNELNGETDKRQA